MFTIKLLQLLKSANRILLDETSKILSEHGFSPEQWDVLTYLYTSGDSNCMTIAEAIDVHSPSLSRMLNTLEHKRGAVKRYISDCDQREVIVVMTPKCKKLYKRILTKIEKAEQKTVNRVGIDNIGKLGDALQNVQQAV